MHKNSDWALSPSMIASSFVDHDGRSLLAVGVKAHENESVEEKNLKVFKSFSGNLQFTNSSSSGTRDRRSKISLFVTACGRMMRLENFIIPHIISKALIGIKCSTIMAPNSRRAVSQLNSGTEKLKVLQRKRRQMIKKVLIMNWN